MARFISEDNIEKATIELLQTPALAYNYINCYTEDPENLNDNSNRRDKREVVLADIMIRKLCEINPNIPQETLVTVVEEWRNPIPNREIIDCNYTYYQLIRNGVKVKYQKDGKDEYAFCKIIDFEDPEKNDFTVVSQLWIKALPNGKAGFRRPDLLVYVNGLPLVFIELKNSDIPVKNAYDKNLQDYKRDIPYLFYFNQICALSNGLETRVGAFNADYEFFFEWLKVESENERPDRKKIYDEGISLEYFAKGVLGKHNLIDYIQNFILFDRKKTKIIAKNHQFIGVNNSIVAFENRNQLDGKLGVFWHTQGSGKSYSMIMLARKIMRCFEGNYTFLMITDRADLDEQLWKNFVRTEVILETDETRPKNSKQLRDFLQTNKSCIFTLIHKFRYDKGKKYPVLSERDDIIVFVDEAHRTQYKDLADNMRMGLPNAQYIAFTGTPLLGSKRLTNKWFGDYVSEYNFAQSVEDHATVPLYYKKNVKQVILDNKYLDDDFLDIISQDNLSEEEASRLAANYAKEMEVLKRDSRLDEVAYDIVEHFPNRGYLGKGMVITVDKFTAVKMYDKVQYFWKSKMKELIQSRNKETDEIRREEITKTLEYMSNVEMAVIVSEEEGEEKKFAEQGLDIKPHRIKMKTIDEEGNDIEDRFKSPTDPLQLVFVCSMWLTGFDAPTVSTLYLDKPMKGHTLMQAIARANRVAHGKKSGLIIDFLNVFKYVKRALKDYASGADGGDMPVKDVENLYLLLDEAIKETDVFCSSLGIDLRIPVEAREVFKNLDFFAEAVDVILQNDEYKNQFKVLSNAVDALYEACKPEIFSSGWDNPLKEVILYLRGVLDNKIRPERLEEARKKMDALLDRSVFAEKTKTDDEYDIIIKSGKEVNLADLDIEKIRSQFKESKYKNIEINDMRMFIEHKLQIMLQRNVTRTHFAEYYRRIIEMYNAGGSKNENFYEELIKFVENLKEEEERHIRENLSEEELEIFDLLYKEHLTKKEEQQVKLAAQNLYKTLQEKKKILFVVDWYKDSSTKEKVRTEVQSVLNQYLPENYDRDIFNTKTQLVFKHIIDMAQRGYGWVA